TSNELVSFRKGGKRRSFVIAKGRLAERGAKEERHWSGALRTTGIAGARHSSGAHTRTGPVAAPPVPAMSVMGIGSWPRPRWMVEAMHAFVEGKLDEAAFHETADGHHHRRRAAPR